MNHRRTEKIRTVLALLLSTSILILAVGACGRGGKELATIGSEKITEGDLDILVRVNPRLKPRLSTPAGREKVLENYVEQELLYQESKRRGLATSAAVKDKIALYQKIIVAQALLDDELDKKVKEYYTTHQNEFERIKASHILIRIDSTQTGREKAKGARKPIGHSEAEAIRLAELAKARIAKGEDFGKVAKAMSEDERTKGNQGDLGYLTLGDKRLERMAWLPLAEKAFAMKAGEVSDPIKTRDGYHVLMTTEEKKLSPFDEAEAGIKFRMQADIRSQLLDELKKKYKVEFAKTETAPEPSPAPVAPETAPAAPVPAAPPAPPQ